MRKVNLKYVIFFAVSFLVSTVYFLTTAPTTAFWDVGEFLAASKILGIPHPPGTPLYVIIANFFTYLPLPLKEIFYLIYKLPAHQDVLRMTMIPILTGGFTAGIFYLLFVEIVETFENRKDYHPLWVHISGVFVALLQSFTYTQWFNSIEVETYTPANFLALLGVYFAFLWLKNIDRRNSIKYLILSAYVIILGTGIHLGVLIGFFAVFLFLVIFERKFFIDDDFWATLAVALAVVSLWFNSYHIAQVMELQREFANLSAPPDSILAFDPQMVYMELQKLESSVLRWNIAYGISIAAMYWQLYRRNRLKGIWGISFVILSIISVGSLFLYGDLITLWISLITGFASIILFFLISNIYRGWKGAALIVVFLAVVVEFWLIARANYLQNFPNIARINEGDPYTWVAFMDVLSRKQYGPTSFFHRRIPIVEQLQVFWTYLSWQFTSKPYYTREQYTPILYIVLLLMFLGFYVHYRGSKKSFYLVFMLFIMATFGMIFLQNPADAPSLPVNPNNAVPDPITGIPRMEVRDREYFYALGYSMIIFYSGFGLLEIMKYLGDLLKNTFRPIYWGVPGILGLVFSVLTVGKVFAHNLKFNDRHKNYMAEDFAYNILSSPRHKIFITENGDTLRSVIFTNGDNDTFPLWFVQEVLGYRREDLVVANLSLLNTNSYVRQVKHWGAPMTLSDEDIEKLPVVIPLKEPFERKQFRGKTLKRFLLLRDIAIRDMVAGAVGYEPEEFVNIVSEKGIVRLPKIYLADDETFLREVVLGKDFKVNIYFSMTTDPDAYYTFEKTFILEGIAWRITNEVRNIGETPFKSIDLERTKYLLFGNFKPTEYIEKYAKKYKIADEGIYRYRTIFDRSVYKDPTHLRILRNYFSLFNIFAEALRINGEDEYAAEVYEVSRKLIHEYLYFRGERAKTDGFLLMHMQMMDQALADIYEKLGKYDRAIKILEIYKEQPMIKNKLIKLYLLKGDTLSAISLGYNPEGE